jgi:hypothetical protein
LGLYLCILDQILKRETVRLIAINGVKVYVRTSTPDLSVAISSLYEKEYDHILCSNPKTIVDAGANIGTSSIFFAKKYPNARVIAIEPEESNFDFTKNMSNYKISLQSSQFGGRSI